MKKQLPAAERSEEEEEEGSMDDRLSQLPQPILQHILSLLDQDAAVRTSILSKPWRYHWTTRPNIDFRQSRRFGNNKAFSSALDKTLERYHAQNLPIHQLRVEKWMVDSDSNRLLEKWIPILRIFDLYFVFSKNLLHKHKDIPSSYSVFEAENLQKLHLERCRLNLTSIGNVLLCKRLRTLHLVRVHIPDDKTFEKIVSICPLIEFLTLDKCTGFRITGHELNNFHHLKYFDFTKSKEDNVNELSIEIDVPSIETIKINAYLIGIHYHKHFPNLKSLTLEGAKLTSNSFDFFSWDLPSLENLELKRCDGNFIEFRLLSRSIKRLSIKWRFISNITRATIDAPAILYFKYSSTSLPSIFTFTTISNQWESHLRLDFGSIFDPLWFLKLNFVLQSLSHSEIYLRLQNCGSWIGEISEEVVGNPGIFGERVVVEHLKLNLGDYSLASYSAFINELFLICRPRNITERESNKHLTMKLCQILVAEREKRDDYSWSKDLEDIRVQIFDESGKQLINRVEGTDLLIICSAAKLLAKIQDRSPEICFGLKWRERTSSQVAQ